MADAITNAEVQYQTLATASGRPLFVNEFGINYPNSLGFAPTLAEDEQYQSTLSAFYASKGEPYYWFLGTDSASCPNWAATALVCGTTIQPLGMSYLSLVPPTATATSTPTATPQPTPVSATITPAPPVPVRCNAVPYCFRPTTTPVELTTAPASKVTPTSTPRPTAVGWDAARIAPSDRRR